MIIKLAGCILLDNQGKIALLHRNKNGKTQWELPGGKIEPNEPEEDTAKRELKEELGVTVNLQKRVGDTRFVDSNGSEYEYIWFFATISQGTPSVCEPDTFDDFNYFSIEELESLELSSNMQQLLRQLKGGEISLINPDLPYAIAFS